MSSNTTEILMPLMGEGVNEATLVKWLKKVGDKVEKDEALLEVSTDKVDTEIPAPSSGFIIVQSASEGDTVEVDQLLAVISDDKNATYTPSETTIKKSSIQTKNAERSAGQSVTQTSTGPVLPVKTSSPVHAAHAKSSPLVRKIALENNVNLQFVQGTGLSGRITKNDIVRFIESGGVPETSVAPAAGAFHALKTENVNGQEFLDGVPVKREKMTKMRRLIAEHMVESVRVSPHVTTVFEMDLQKIVEIREAHKNSFKQREGFNLTFTHFFIHACVQAIKAHPIMNTSLDGDEVLFKDDINIGCAVAIESGLIVPVIKKAQNLDLAGTARALNDLATRARSKKLNPDDVKGGTFSITNPGGFGSLTSNPIINQPQVAILGIGNIVKRPVVIEDAIVIRPMILMSITFDHRVVDGEGGAKFLATLKNILENYSEKP